MVRSFLTPASAISPRGLVFLRFNEIFTADCSRVQSAVKISLNRRKTSPRGEIADAGVRKLLTIASGLAFQYSENGQDAYRITRRAFVELFREGFFEKRKPFGPRLGKPRSAH